MTGQNKPVAVEDRYENPAKVKVGGILTLDTIDLSHLLFTVRDRQQWTRYVNGNKRTFTDYRLLARPHDGEDVEVVLRMIPIENPDKLAKLTHNCVALRPFFYCSWANEAEREGILEAVNDPAGELVYERGTPQERTFYRINSKEPYECEVAIISDLNNDGKIEENEVRQAHYLMWDYYSKTVKDGQEVYEFLYVHQDQDSKDFVMWIGEEIDLTRIRG